MISYVRLVTSAVMNDRNIHEQGILLTERYKLLRQAHIYIFCNHIVSRSFPFDWITVDWMIRIDEHP